MGGGGPPDRNDRDRPGEVGRQVDRPASLAGDRDAYAVTMVGDSMWPRFRAGRRLLVSPAAPVAVGDDVLVRLPGGRRGGSGAVRADQGVGASNRGFVELRQFNPDVDVPGRSRRVAESTR